MDDPRDNKISCLRSTYNDFAPVSPLTRAYKQCIYRPVFLDV